MTVKHFVRNLTLFKVFKMPPNIIKIAAVGYSYVSVADHFIGELTALLEYLNGDGGKKSQHVSQRGLLLTALVYTVITAQPTLILV